MKKIFLSIIFVLSCTSLFAGTGTSSEFILHKNLSTASSPFTLHVDDKLVYDATFVYGYNRTAAITANSTSVSNYFIKQGELESGGLCNWDYLDESASVLPRNQVYVLSHTITDDSGNVLDTLRAYATFGGISENVDWTLGFSLDTVNIAAGKTVQLLPTDWISFGAFWAEGSDRKITITASSEDNATSGLSSILSVSDYHVFTSDLEEYGEYNWDYSSVSPAILPRSDIYTLTYKIYDENNGTTFAIVDSLPNFTIVPEPGSFLIFAIGILFLVKKER